MVRHTFHPSCQRLQEIFLMKLRVEPDRIGSQGGSHVGKCQLQITFLGAGGWIGELIFVEVSYRRQRCKTRIGKSTELG
ncbi:MAG: hypothetical protein CL681_19675 [Blastopirellula sp.]|nr:hypothetical protein [Blastopirellula sp.]